MFCSFCLFLIFKVSWLVNIISNNLIITADSSDPANILRV